MPRANGEARLFLWYCRTVKRKSCVWGMGAHRVHRESVDTAGTNKERVLSRCQQGSGSLSNAYETPQL